MRRSLIRDSVLFALIWCVHLPLAANMRQQLFEQGNQFYNQGDYREALASYQGIVDMHYENGPLYFNMGNCYYKLGEVGKAILYYERARRFIPRDDDLKNNLAIARLAVVDQIVPGSDFILLQVYYGFLTFLPKAAQTGIVTFAYLLLITGILFFILSKRQIIQIIGYRMIWIFGLLFIVFASAWALRLADEKTRVEAVIMADKVSVLSAPTENGGVELFTLHAGTKARLDQTAGDWVEIILPDRKAGWVKQDVLERI